MNQYHAGVDTRETRRARLRLLIDDRYKGNQSAFAAAIGRQADYISRVLGGKKNLGDDLAREIEKREELPRYWLETDQPLPAWGERAESVQPPSVESATALASSWQHSSPLGVRAWERAEDLYGDDVPIRRAAVRLHGGPGRLQFEPLEKPALPFQRSWLESKGIRPDGAWLLTVEGDSMEEMYCDGDTVLVDTNDKVVVDGRAYAIAGTDGYRIKYLLKRTDGGLTIHSHNSDKYPDEILTPDAAQDLVIVGRVRWRAG